MVNGLDGVYVERDGKLEETDAQFFSEQHVLRVIDRIVAPLGRRIDEASPMVDARLPDGSRVNAVIAPLADRRAAAHHPQVHADACSPLDDLVRLGTLTDQVGGFLAACVEGRMNILVSGGTGSGKTTLLNVLSSMIPDDRAHRDHRGRRRAAAAAAPRRPAREPPAEHRRQGRGRAPASWCATRCACGPTASSSARSAAPRRSTCSRR